ncbi:hypothetical protein LTR78_008799 [Recurvomyces mirabilis]|uniref:Uncharacterized protein n=1 Tax=Recurvomyces mirabilis TaxID=574656 RepID=A0AAE0TSU0_9PEZI|nr:hypothetical protein LTR78_008799 [Recurvomyces mirabilis]KAK5160963.1 hypothetical protein LTS14_000757 [Recurvomyces mirabilis]
MTNMLLLDRRRIFWITIISGIAIAGFILLLFILQLLLVPVLVYIFPGLEAPFYDLALFGAYRTQDYVSFNLTSPQTSTVRWDDSCDQGYIFLDPSGPAVGHRGPLIVDAQGGLIWTSDQFQTTTNLKVQTYRGKEFMTFWSGQKAKTMGTGSYYMMDDTYRVVHKVDAVGDGAHGDLHEFKITSEGTALLTVYNKTQADLTGMGWFRSDHGWIVDSVFQEVDIATGALLFQWKASDHFSAADSYMTNPFGGYTEGIPFDFFHINSIEKDRNGNYLISSRHFHSVMTIDGQTGEVLWQLGGRSDEFEDLSDGKASDFSWQHDARWLDEEEGILSLFDNGYAWPHYNAPYSQGLFIKIDFEAQTAELTQSFVSSGHALSSSQGSVQPVLTEEGEEHVFIGWGSSAAFGEFTMEGELLCETHFAASSSFWWERVKSYRAFKMLYWSGTPALWDPSAAISDGKLYVSWNGATEVAYWELHGTVIVPEQEQGQWQDVDVAEKDGFETSFSLQTVSGEEEGARPYTYFRVAALDAERNLIRYSNIIITIAALWHYRKRSWKIVDWRQMAQNTIDRTKYQKLW